MHRSIKDAVQYLPKFNSTPLAPTSTNVWLDTIYCIKHDHHRDGIDEEGGRHFGLRLRSNGGSLFLRQQVGHPA
jgi:hypothetical protein